ncbi:Uncharacterised protein [Serratia marcescens]|nr:Uncharacterised protein [Serratia marcescens]CVE05618.1 Uncharacterised protein [Serratia marcescens]
MVLRLELALRAAAVRLHQSVVGVVAVVLFVQAVAPADQVAPGVVTVKQFLPVRQPVIGDRRQRQVRVDVALRAAFAQQVIRQIVHQPRARFALIGLAVLQQAAFGVVTVVHFAAQRVAHSGQLAAAGIAISAPQHAVFRPGQFVVAEGAALPAAAPHGVVTPLLLQRALAAAGFPVQAIAGEFAHHLLVEFDGAGVAGAVIQPLQAIALRQRQRLQVGQRIPLVLQLAIHALLTEQPPGGVIAHLHAVRLDAQRRAARRRQAVQLAQPPHGVETVMPFRAGVAAPDQLPSLVEAEALFALRQLTRAARQADLSVLLQQPGCAVAIIVAGVVRALFGQHAAHRIVAEAVFAAVAVLQPRQPALRAVVIASGAVNAVGDADRQPQGVVLPAGQAAQRVLMFCQLAVRIPVKALFAAVRVDQGVQAPAVIPPVARLVAFGIGLRRQLPQRIVGISRHAAGTVGVARQLAAGVPLQLHLPAQRVDHTSGQALFVIRIAVQRGIAQGIDIARRAPQRVPMLRLAAAVRVRDGEQPAAVARILIARHAAERIGLRQQAAVRIPFTLALRAAGQQHAAQFAALVDKTVAALVEVGVLRHVVIVIQPPLRALAVAAHRAAAPTGEVITELQRFSGAVAVGRHARHAVNLLPLVFVQQPGGVLVADHQAVAPAEAARYLSGAVAHRRQLALLIVTVARQRPFAFGGLQRHFAQAALRITAHQALPGAVHQFAQQPLVVVKQRGGVADGVGDHTEPARLIARQRRVVENLFADVKQLPAAVVVVHQPAFFGFAVGFVAARHPGESDEVTGRRAPHQAVLIRLQAALPE